MLKTKRMIAALALVAAASGCAHSPPDDPQDPLEPVNRVVYSFNSTLDRYALRPVARAYVKVTPEPVRDSVGNFFGNFFYPVTIANNLLQAKFAQAGRDTGRFLINTTLGVAGFFDVAERDFGLPANREDLGQTLGYWGVGEGWYLMIPFLGPSTNRDFVGRLGDVYFSPLTYVELDYYERLGIGVAMAVDARAQYLSADKLLADQLDPYAFVRTAYLQRRAASVSDGKPIEDSTPSYDITVDEVPVMDQVMDEAPWQR